MRMRRWWLAGLLCLPLLIAWLIPGSVHRKSAPAAGAGTSTAPMAPVSETPLQVSVPQQSTPRVVTHAQTGPAFVTAGPAARAASGRLRLATDGRKPYRKVQASEYWAFSPRRTWYAAHGVLEALLDGSFAVIPLSHPAYAEVTPEAITVSPSARWLALNRQPHPQGYTSVGPVLVPVRPLRAHQPFVFDVAWSEARVPYLHDDRRPAYLLSLRFSPEPDRPRIAYHFAVPDTCRGIRCSDLQPSGSRHFPGWTVYDYRAASDRESLIHLGFTMPDVAVGAPPSARAVLSGD